MGKENGAVPMIPCRDCGGPMRVIKEVEVEVVEGKG